MPQSADPSASNAKDCNAALRLADACWSTPEINPIISGASIAKKVAAARRKS